MKINEQSSQLVLNLGHRTALGRDDFLVSDCNTYAVSWIDKWPNWPASGLVIWGPQASGKSHLGHVWMSRIGAPLLTVNDLDINEPPDLVTPHPAIYIDDLADIAGNYEREVSFLHVYNLVVEQGKYILLSSRTPPGRWNVKLADLRSRLNALPAVMIASPDDRILEAVLLKLFSDRQLEVGIEVVQFAITRMIRTFAAAEKLVHTVDLTALATKRRVTIPLLREVFDTMENV
jgi:chromosomal replication initiation ATPase DnaA